jgi:lipopolysaccharide transport system ATP-binding protein
MTNPAIEVHSLTKVYEIGHVRELAGGWLRRAVGGKPAQRQTLTALDNVSLTIAPGEAVGIIGGNGAGKSTLLKVLTRVTAPTSGHGIVRGRVGTILEVGTGFHPELTGRENVFLSGAILGLQRHEVIERFESIVEFAGVAAMIDAPVKRYSSGMYVRLAFAVAAHLDPDILVVDEVLAVGDIGFQKRCLQRMEDESRQQGRTILFVSHNLQAIRALCPRSILIEKGRVIADGPTSEVIQVYLSSQSTRLDLRERSIANRTNRTGGRVKYSSVQITDMLGKEKWAFNAGEDIHLSLDFAVIDPVESLGIQLSFVATTDNALLSTIKEVVTTESLRQGETGQVRLVVSTKQLRPGSFALTCCLGNEDMSIFEDVIDSNVGLPYIEIESKETDSNRRIGLVDLEYRFETDASPSKTSHLAKVNEPATDL